MASSVTKGQIQKLRDAGYLSGDIAHRLPDEGELIPISSADWASHFIPLSGGSYSTTA